MKQKNIIIALVVLAVIGMGGGAYALVSQNNKTRESEAMMKKAESEAMMKDDKMAKTGEDAMKKDGDAMKQDDAMMAKGIYTDYDQAKLANAEKGKVVLFFHATWCPECQRLEKTFNASATPDGLTLLKVDYDTATELKKKYGITMQHTFVQVDKDGKLIKKWSGSGTDTYDDIKAQIN